jgi:hypothetical protein
MVLPESIIRLQNHYFELEPLGFDVSGTLSRLKFLAPIRHAIKAPADQQNRHGIQQSLCHKMSNTIQAEGEPKIEMVVL